MVLHETARFQYLKWDDKFKIEKPYQILSGLSGQIPISKTNVAFEISEENEEITDIREHPELYNLDETGFCVQTVNSDFSDWFQKDQVEAKYIPQVVEPILWRLFETATRIIIFDWHLRRNDEGLHGSRMDLNDSTHPLKPAKVVHVDQTPLGVVRRVRHLLGDDAEQALQGRVRLINFWKPLRYPVEDAPLAICDGSVVKPSDLVAVDLVRRSYVGETAFALQSPHFRWHYLGNQKETEVLVFKIFDSSSDCRAKSWPHASFAHSKRVEKPRPRESIEIRALILSDA